MIEDILTQSKALQDKAMSFRRAYYDIKRHGLTGDNSIAWEKVTFWVYYSDHYGFEIPR